MDDMSRRLRFLPPNSLVEVTSRTLQGRLLLQPTHHIAELCRGVLARAVRLFPVEIHAFAFLGNHYHLLLSASNSQRLADFMNYLNSNLAREVGRSVGWRERFWGRRYQAIPVAEEEAAQVERLLYILRHGCKEGLVRRPADWPGATSIQGLLTGKPISGPWIDRSLEYELGRRGRPYDRRICISRESFELTPLPCWRHLAPEAYRARVAELIHAVELETARRLKERDHEALGAERAARQNPHHAPNRIQRRPAPLLHAASQQARRVFRDAYRQFVRAFREASRRYRSIDGARDRFEMFPLGSFPPPGPFIVPT
jgi:REP element-mobilizing transposase RayT